MATEIDNELKKVAGELVGAADKLAGLEALVIIEDSTRDSRCTMHIPEGMTSDRVVEILAEWIDVSKKRQSNWPTQHINL